MTKIAIVTDAWEPQINGVVTTLKKTRDTLQALGHEVVVIEPGDCKTIPCPTYPEIRLAIRPKKHVSSRLDSFLPQRIHIATEGPLGLAARKYCRQKHYAFTTSYHTQFPEYIRERVPVPLSITCRFYRWFHSAATRTLVGTPHLKSCLEQRDFQNIVLWSRGVDHSVFKPGSDIQLDFARPIWTYAGRVAVEKNLSAFLDLELPGTKMIIGDGPAKKALVEKYPDARFMGYHFGPDLAAHLSAADVFVFPSVTDTFGIVMIEAMACGLPVAAFPVTGPRDVVRDGITGSLNNDLKAACLNALKLDPADCIEQAKEYTWENATQQFYSHLTAISS